MNQSGIGVWLIISRKQLKNNQLIDQLRSNVKNQMTPQIIIQ